MMFRHKAFMVWPQDKFLAYWFVPRPSLCLDIEVFIAFDHPWTEKLNEHHNFLYLQP